ncbi:hypothetical protein FIBSPDRAFT_911025 [Athelia psychrophila]|uniref:Kinetochore protein Spc24 n=1 Tax=Athelia psychrophila TaxID=1759441 RepID=A0A166JHL9_9AGAM|nr:hypothetical protein FIBSPDRAFT_911025 [Fibularhizoctonia sp. CBS 109695]
MASSTDIQEAIKLMKDMAPMLDPDEDYITIAETEQQTAATKAQRKKELEDMHAHLKALIRTLDTSRASATRPPTVPSATEHSSFINELESSRLSLAKAINDAESELASTEAELTRLKDEARTLEEYDPASEHEKELDGTAMRLQIYKGLGFEPVADKDGRLNKMLIRAQSGDVHVISFDEGKNTDYTALLWKLASS